jgi:chlorite dismutase
MDNSGFMSKSSFMSKREAIRMRKLSAFVAIGVFFLWTGPVFAQQGQWGGFIYLTPKSALSPEKKETIVKALQEQASGFSNDFTPEKGKLETIQFYKGEGKSANGPTGLIRVESMTRAKMDGFHKAASAALKEYFDLEYRVGVTAELNYTDAATLDQLKANAPTRGNGTDQPHAVVLPVAKTAAWWALPLDKRKQYFDKHPETLGKNHAGHNEIGFIYIKSVFRKLYHSRFVDDQQDFMTYFEFSDKDVDAYKSLLAGLRDKEKNPEWEYVQERPIFWGERKSSIADIL